MKNQFPSFSPAPLVWKFEGHAKRGKALDLGAGRGDNAIFLTGKGFQVTAVELRKDLSETIKKRAKKNKVKINVKNQNIKDFVIQPDQYSFISAINSLHFLSKKEFYETIQQVRLGLLDGGVCVISVLTADDPLYKKSEARGIRYFPKSGELKEIFGNFKILFYIETIIQDKGHPNHEQPHKHAIARIAAKKGKGAKGKSGFGMC
jgi:cyclopropane fatty-acyl-phospholipid synthase-like methyltransferase